MSSEQQPELRLPPFFPRVVKKCEKEAQTFFSCFSEKGDYQKGGDPAVSRKALAACASLLPAYETCTAANLTDRQKELVKAPEVYVKQAQQPQQA